MKEQAVSKTQKKEKKEKKEKRELTYEEKVKVYDSKELYEDFSVDQLRKISAAKRLKPQPNWNREDLIQKCWEHDTAIKAIVNAGGTHVAPVEELKIPKKTKHCAIRLLNILFSDAYAVQFAQIGNTATRSQIDQGQTNSGNPFWASIHSEFNSNTKDYGELNSDLAHFFGIDPSIIIPHSKEKLLSIWKEVNAKYRVAFTNFTKSGNHQPDFWGYCQGATDVMYLRIMLVVKPNLTASVNGGFLQKDQFDSICLSSDLGSSTSTPIIKRKRHDSNDIFAMMSKILKTPPKPPKNPGEIIEQKLELEMKRVQGMEQCIASLFKAKQRVKDIEESVNIDEDDLHDAKADVKYFLGLKKNFRSEI